MPGSRAWQKRSAGFTMRSALLAANLVVSVISGAFCVVAMTSPQRLLRAHGSAGPTARFYLWFYAVRQLPLTVAIVVAAVGDSAGLPLLLAVAGAAQAGDSALGAWDRNPGMTLGGAVAAVLHLGSACWWLLRA
ncbi:MAG: hypothetical protein QG671_3000 [Actinomycetota bacterium]|nr:hypothetical protein [Actinomycetota bacterium]